MQVMVAGILATSFEYIASLLSSGWSSLISTGELRSNVCAWGQLIGDFSVTISKHKHRFGYCLGADFFQ